MLESVLAATARHLCRHRPRWIASFAVALGLSGWVGAQVAPQLDADDFLPTRERSGRRVDAEEEEVRRLGGAGRLVVVLESDHPIDIGQAGPLLERVASALRAFADVRSVEYRIPSSVRRAAEQYGTAHFLLYVDSADLQSARARLSKEAIEEQIALLDMPVARALGVLPPFRQARKDPLGVMRLARRTMDRLSGNGPVELIDGYYGARGGRKLFVVAEPAQTVKDSKRAAALVDSVMGVLDVIRADPAHAALLGHARLTATGRPVSYVSAFRTILRDVQRIAVVSAGVVYVVLVAFFRRLFAPLALLLPVACGLVLAAGFGGVVFPEMNLFAWILIGLLIGLGIDFALHIGAHYWTHGHADEPRIEAVIASVVRPGRGIVFGALTSAAAFLSLLVLSYPAFKQIAWLTVIGILAILVSSLTLLPVILSFAKPGRSRHAMWTRWSAVWDRASRATPWLSALPWVVGVTLCLGTARAITVEAHPWSLAVRGNPESAELERLTTELGFAFTPLLMISSGRTEDEALGKDREAVAVVQQVARQGGVAAIRTLSHWIPPIESQLSNKRFIDANRALFSPRRFRTDFLDVLARRGREEARLRDEYVPLVARYLNPDPELVSAAGLRSAGLGDAIERHLHARNGEHWAVSYIYLTRFPWVEGAVNTFLEAFDGAAGSSLTDVRFAGEPLRSASHARTVKRDAVRGLAVAAVLIIGVLWLQFRRGRYVVLCLLPLACGVSGVLGVMALLDIELNLLTMAVAPILVGIGVDDGIHMVERLRSGQDVSDALREAGSSMTMTTLTTVGAFASMGLASFVGIRDFGLLGGVGVVVCLVASLHLVPLGYRLLSPR